MGSWSVLRCPSSKTKALVDALNDDDIGAWTPMWRRKRRLPRSSIYRLVDTPAMASFVFVPLSAELPEVPGIPFSFMRKPDGSQAIVPDNELDPLRDISIKPKVTIRLPHPGSEYKLKEGAFAGLTARIIHCTKTVCTVAMEGFKQPIKVPPSIFIRNES